MAADDIADVTFEAELDTSDAEREIDEAVRGRRSVARRYVRSIRRRHADASPAEVIALLERHYVTAISTAGVALTVGSLAAEVAIGLIPGGGSVAAVTKASAKGAAKTVTKEVAKAATKEVMKTAAKTAALGAAKSGAQKAASMLPAGDKQLQFEITALFALAIADIHGLEYDQDQAHTLVYGLSNGRVSQEQIAAMAADLANSSGPEISGTGQAIAGGRKDWSHWANTLADALPGGAAQNLVRGVQTGVLEDVRVELGATKQAAVEYGVGALVGGVTRFVFGREVVGAARVAFPEAPAEFPSYLDAPAKPDKADEQPNRALEALEGAARAAGSGVSVGVTAVGAGMSAAGAAVSRPFRSVDLDGDGVADEARALTAVKAMGRSTSGMVSGAAASLFRRGKRVSGKDDTTAGDDDGPAAPAE